jgi:hypothetical protein
MYTGEKTMIIIREVFTAKPGQASKLAALFKKGFSGYSNVRIMTDVVGKYNTVVVEMQMNSLAEFEKEMEEYRSGKPDPRISPEVAEEMSKYTEMYLTGRREIYRVVE